MKKILILSLVLFSVTACAQDKPAKPKPKAPPTVDTKSPVTKAEARAVFVKAASVLKPVIKQQYGVPMVADSAAPVTRAEVVAELNRLFVASKPAFKFTPKKVSFDRNRLTLKAAPQRANLERLIAFGTVAKLGPLSAGDKDSLTVKEFGDAVGFFISRVAELTHTPSARWTPGLQAP